MHQKKNEQSYNQSNQVRDPLYATVIVQYNL